MDFGISFPVWLRLCRIKGLGRCRGEWQNRNVTRSFDRRCHLPLVLCTVARDPPGNDFSPFGNKISEDSRVLIIDVHFLIGAESTNLAPDERFFLPVGSGSFRPVHSSLLSHHSPLSGREKDPG